jgi:CYTH domain-containing protein
MKIEIERKFLLKSLPKKTPDQSVDIDQFYLKTPSGIWERARTWFSSNGDRKYIHTIKKNISKGVNIEDEYLMTEEDFLKFKEKCFKLNTESKHIKKIRHIYKDDNLFWEIDEFKSNYKLIIAEVEIPKKNYKLNIPNFIEELVLLEVTGIKQFNNKTLSIKIE